MKQRPLKHSAYLTALVLGTSALGLLAQTEPPSPPMPQPARSLRSPILPPPPSAPAADGLTKFDLDFPGGSPKELTAAIEKAMGRRLNVIVPEEFESVKMPALKMEHIDVAQLFQALQAASRKDEAVTTGSNGFPGGYQPYQVQQTGYGFKQGNESHGPNDDTIWYFYVTKPNLPPLSAAPKKVCRFYSLAPYLERGLTVDDITTAIETGWKMLGEPSAAFGGGTSGARDGTISFHKDTKLLIAVGEPSKLETIDAVLKALELPKDPLGDFQARLKAINDRGSAAGPPPPSAPP